MNRAILTLCAVGAFLCVSGPETRAGDPEAHALAMIRAANKVAAEAAFALGVGAPKVNGVVVEGDFKIPTDDDTPCPYEPENEYGEGCAYRTLNGMAINEPDNWACNDPRQPETLRLLNSRMAPVQAWIATLAARVSEKAAMACNWTHFTNNPILPRSGASDALATYELVSKWADEIPQSILDNGATSEYRCDTATWEMYYARVANSLHFIQDMATEHHSVGNAACSASDPIPVFAASPLRDITEEDECTDWLVETELMMTGTHPAYLCDGAVVDGVLPASVSLTWDMLQMDLLCNAGVRLACMGLERVFRHHCRLDTPKTIDCAGPMDDHSLNSYCEGETYSGGGENFITNAKDASVPLLRAAAQRWADVCKQPDDPCIPDQCQKWWYRSTGATTGHCCDDGQCSVEQCGCPDGEESCGSGCCQIGECFSGVCGCPEGQDLCGLSGCCNIGECVEGLCDETNVCEIPPACTEACSFECPGSCGSDQPGRTSCIWWTDPAHPSVATQLRTEMVWELVRFIVNEYDPPGIRVGNAQYEFAWATWDISIVHKCIAAGGVSLSMTAVPDNNNNHVTESHLRVGNECFPTTVNISKTIVVDCYCAAEPCAPGKNSYYEYYFDEDGQYILNNGNTKWNQREAALGECPTFVQVLDLNDLRPSTSYLFRALGLPSPD